MSPQSLRELVAFGWVFAGAILFIVGMAIYNDWKSRRDADNP